MPRPPVKTSRATAFRVGSRQQALRWKEFVLLRRDPWLVSQSLMQLLYLVPPALMLWRSFADSSLAIVLITPVIVMAAGQLAGGLAWLTISGEDAADLVATAPLPSSRVIRAKIEVVLIAIGVTVRAAGAGADIRLAAAGGRHRARVSSSRRPRPPRSSSGSACRHAAASFAAARPRRGWRPSRKPFPRSDGPRPRRWRWRFPSPRVISGLMTAAILAATWKISPRRE